jgi:hypothetical protein
MHPPQKFLSHLPWSPRVAEGAGLDGAGAEVSLREIVVVRPDHDQPLYLLTNHLQRPALEIAQLYKERWEIELLFKWLSYRRILVTA